MFAIKLLQERVILKELKIEIFILIFLSYFILNIFSYFPLIFIIIF